ncbi:MAG: GtrA family protein [Verrucomicrobia bacterium]|nr:GtrA family protein [Verrucomicrobiota bacterium]
MQPFTSLIVAEWVYFGFSNFWFFGLGSLLTIPGMGFSRGHSNRSCSSKSPLIGMFTPERIMQLIRFCTVGGSVAVIDLSVVWTTSHFLPALVAVSLGYIIGVTCHFLLNKFWVFRCASQQYRRQVALYLLHITLYWLMTMLIVSLVLSLTHASVVVARVVSIPPMTLFTFCFLRFVIFNKRSLRANPLRHDARNTDSGSREIPTPGSNAYTLQTDLEANR